MSVNAKELATAKKIKYSLDSEKFLTDTIRQCPEIYPVLQSLDQDAQQLMPSVFMENTHARHMLYTEGGNNMFATLRAGIKSGTLSKEQYALWFSRWVINIAGFRGHEETQGSIYLTQSTATSIIALKQELDKLWDNPNYDVLAGYLAIRAQWLQVPNIFLAHIGALMRLHTPEEGMALKTWFNKLSAEQQRVHEASFNTLRYVTQVTPTYEPAVLDNLKALGCSVEEAITIHTLIKLEASQAYCAGLNQKRIAIDTPLCFRGIAFKDNLEPIVAYYRENGKIPAITVADNGDVVADKIALQPKMRL